jgi:hypothetical protein
MAHYAFLDANNIVTQVIVGRDEDEVVGGVTDWEAHYEFVTGQVCKRTSYNTYRDYTYTLDDETGEVISVQYLGSKHRTGGTPFRGQYAGIGDRYDAELDEFITPESETPDETE